MTILLPHVNLQGMRVNYSRISLDNATFGKETFVDTLTLDIPYDETVTTQKVSFGWNVSTNTSTLTSSPNAGSNTYELLMSSDCGPVTCASPPLGFFTPEHQVQALHVCLDNQTATFDLIGVASPCKFYSNNDLFLVGIGSRVESDPVIRLGPYPDPSSLGV